MMVGKHGRLTYRKGTMNLSNLLDDQISSRDIDGRARKLVTGMSETLRLSPNQLILLVSANQQVRDELRDLVQSRLHSNMRLLELEHQPAEKSRFWNSLWNHKTVDDYGQS